MSGDFNIGPMELYLVRMTHPESGEAFWKIGVSEDSKKRFRYGKKKIIDCDLSSTKKMALIQLYGQYLPDHPYDVETRHVSKFFYNGEARIAERDILKIIKETKSQHWPEHRFSGSSECFLSEGPEGEAAILVIIAFMDSQAKAKEPDLTHKVHYKIASSHVGRPTDEDLIAHHGKILAELEALRASHSKPEAE